MTYEERERVELMFVSADTRTPHSLFYVDNVQQQQHMGGSNVQGLAPPNSFVAPRAVPLQAMNFQTCTNIYFELFFIFQLRFIPSKECAEGPIPI